MSFIVELCKEETKVRLSNGLEVETRYAYPFGIVAYISMLGCLLECGHVCL